MATVPADSAEPTPANYGTSWKAIAIPYAIAIVAQLPMLLLYCRNIWLDKPHYHTLPFAFLATGVIAYWRWPREAKMPFHRSLLSDFLLAVGLLFGVAAVLFKMPEAAAGSVMFLIASLLARTVDRKTLRGLWPASLPMFVFLTLPSGYDIALITTLQRLSAACTTRLLDIVGQGHYMDGTVIQVPGREAYGIEQACSGIQSFFTLIFVAVLYIVVYRRPFFRAVTLLASAVFWALFMNTIRIFLIPVLDQAGIDVVHGLPHAILGWVALAIGILLLLSTDQFITFLFGPVDEEVGRGGPFGKLMTKTWNNLVSGVPVGSSGRSRHAGAETRKTVRKPITKAGKFAIWGLCGILTAFGLWTSYDVQRAFALERKKVRFFDVDVTQPFEEADMPTEIDNWVLREEGYVVDKRTRGSDLGKRSDVWHYKAPNCRPIVSFDQPFPGWHELTTCYQNGGWELVPGSRKVKRGEIQLDGEVKNWGYVTADFRKNTGERAFLAFSLFNSLGMPVAPPADWNRISFFVNGLKNRLSSRFRASLFDNSAYQIQTFVASYGDALNDQVRADVEAQYLKIRQQVRKRFIEKTAGAASEN